MNVDKIARYNFNSRFNENIGLNKHQNEVFARKIADLKDEAFDAIEQLRDKYYDSPLLLEDAVDRIYSIYTKKAFEIEQKAFPIIKRRVKR